MNLHCEAIEGDRKCTVISVLSCKQNATISLHWFLPSLKAKGQNRNDAKEKRQCICDH